ncbi:hypothetical protein [Streptococcus macacae]|uniref:Uncharacterized protein n=1 Tax=Streptococcus macacae NCTC 11558 TaxID=764298 RepID=G5JZ54_9STRE|nr:hypothetical protein [Streptococcus macacae]EHJ51539.1 hypothetical protein STRMA_0471 [Streptococcus macacae NCTC 11558]SUN78307.1 Uncharacterised protein [Streptococcus macacae NCTC 11558]
MKKKYGFYLMILAAAGIVLWLLYVRAVPKTSSNAIKSHQKLYGVTVDDSWYGKVKTADIVAALKAMPVKPTVRIVMSKDRSAKAYQPLFQKIHQVAYIMASPVDSYEMNLYKDTASYQKRFKEAYQQLSAYTDIWEIGNEVNGTDWIKQKDQLISHKLSAAYDTISSAGGKTALTFYYENPDHQHDMFRWIKRNISNHLRKTVDYSFISYYEDDNENYQPHWSSVFKKLQTLFPHSDVGIGECGNTAKKATDKSKKAMAQRYYSMPNYTSRYVGGYFWWNWVQDCVPHENNTVYKTIYHQLK